MMQNTGFEPLLRGEQDPRWFIGGQVVDIKLDGSQTGGNFLMLELFVEPGGGAPQPHIHSREDETLMLLEGEVTVEIGDAKRTVHPGDTVFFPREIPHSFANTGTERARGLGIVAPAGLEEFFRALGVPKKEDERPASYAEPSEEAVRAAADRVGMTLL